MTVAFAMQRRREYDTERQARVVELDTARRSWSKSRKPGGDATGKQRRAARQEKVDYIAAFVVWDAGGRHMEDFQQDRVTCTTKHSKEHVMRGADWADFHGLHTDAVRYVREFKPTKSKKREIGWDDPRTRKPDPAMPSHKRHNDWLHDLGDKYPAAKPTVEYGNLAHSSVYGRTALRSPLLSASRRGYQSSRRPTNALYGHGRPKSDGVGREGSRRRQDGMIPFGITLSARIGALRKLLIRNRVVGISSYVISETCARFFSTKPPVRQP